MLRNTKLITISILPDLLGKLDRIAKEESRTRSELLREAVRRYIEDKEYQDLKRYRRASLENQGRTETVKPSRAAEEPLDQETNA